MELLNKTYLKFIKFKNISGYWDVKRLSFNSSFSSSYEMVRLGEIINPISNKIKKENYDGSRKIVSKITFNNGKLFLRDDNKSGMDVYITYPGNLLVSNINFHQGALAINNFGEEIVCSTHYQPYEINKKLINEEYLILTLRSEEFKNYVVNQKSNGIKTESKFSFIKDLEIPLPTIEDQNNIVEEYNKKLKDSINAEVKAGELEKEIDSYLMEELGIEVIEKEEKKKGLQFVDFKNIKEWELSKIINNNVYFSKYNQFILNELCYNFGNGVNFSSEQVGKGTKFVNIKDVYKDDFLDINGLEQVEISYSEIQSKKITKNDIIFVRSSVKYEGVAYPTLVKNNLEEEVVFCGFLIRCSVNDKIINPEYLLYILKANFIRSILINSATKTVITNISQDKLKNLNIPLPPLEIQEKIVKHTLGLKEEIKRLKNLSVRLKKSARIDFENEIFS